MADVPETPETPDIPGGSEEALRRLLADARHTEPIPVDVAARLDDVLARLAEEEPPGPAVVDLDGRRRRLRGFRLLAAAAAVVVVGTSAAQMLDLEGTGDAASSDTSSVVAGGSTAPDTGGDSGRTAEVAPQAGAPVAGSEAGADSLSELRALDSGFALVPQRWTRLDTAGFGAQVAALRDRLATAATTGSGVEDRTTYGSGGLNAQKSDGCEPADWGEGEIVAVTYNGEPAVLVFRPRTGSTQVVDLLQCGTADVLRSTTVRVE